MSGTLQNLLKEKAAKEQAAAAAVSETVENTPENKTDTGYPVTQTEGVQLPSVDTQLPSYPVTQNEEKLATQLPSEKTYPSRRLRRQKSCRLPAQKLEKWELWCYLNKVDFQDAVEAGLDWVTSQPATHILIDDFEDVGTTDEILIFYHRWTGNRVTQKDKDEREKVRRFSDDICKIGIAITIYRAKSKVNSFKYCIGAIEEMAEMPFENPKQYLNHLQETILKRKTGKS